jgi:hypothetical protein
MIRRSRVTVPHLFVFCDGSVIRWAEAFLSARQQPAGAGTLKRTIRYRLTKRAQWSGLLADKG